MPLLIIVSKPSQSSLYLPSLPNGLYTYLSNFLLKIFIGMDQEGKYDKEIQEKECASVKRIQHAQWTR